MRQIDPIQPITIENIRLCISVDCFKISTIKSFSYFMQDATIITLLYLFRYFFLEYIINKYIYLISIFIWSILTGFWFWCLFVIGHDCGHRTFSENIILCDIIGHICHTILLVPFHSWRLSHLHHHLNHNNIDKDIVWKPLTENQYKLWIKAAKQDWTAFLTYLVRFSICNCLLFPFYLILDQPIHLTTGNHFNPYSRIFNSHKENYQGLLSITLVLGFLFNLIYHFSIITLISWYFIPYIIFTICLSIVTYLHHTDENLKYYDSNEWTYLKGALSTIDRVYINEYIEYFHHNIGTHIVHHLFFSSIPHYNLKQASKDVKSNHPKAKLFMKQDRNYNFIIAYWNCINKLLCIKPIQNNSHVYRYATT